MKKLEDESSHVSMDLMDAPRYILELRDEIKALRAEVEALKPSNPKCERCKDKGFNLVFHSYIGKETVFKERICGCQL